MRLLWKLCGGWVPKGTLWISLRLGYSHLLSYMRSLSRRPWNSSQSTSSRLQRTASARDASTWGTGHGSLRSLIIPCSFLPSLPQLYVFNLKFVMGSAFLPSVQICETFVCVNCCFMVEFKLLCSCDSYLQ